MPASDEKLLHPLLFERGYWEARLQELKLTPLSLLVTPRPEASDSWVEVDEVRIRAHDGVRLYGLRGQSKLNLGRREARIWVVGPCELPEVCRTAVSDGLIEFVFQQPAGRRLEDRVLDALRACQLAASSDRVDPLRIRLVTAPDEAVPDEFLIAGRLRAGPYRL
jgi:hypothetical protein